MNSIYRRHALGASSLVAIAMLTCPPAWAQVSNPPQDQIKPDAQALPNSASVNPPAVSSSPQADSATAPDRLQSTISSSQVQPGDIVVTGFRKSLEDALRIKRNSNSIVDGISAEDIGKSTDQNIAEAMQRVTGVSIDRQDGEGTTVTIRGAGPALNNITLNGVTLTSSANDQSVDLSQFSSDVIQAIKINKTASASQNEGSLGGSVELESFKPLDSRANRRVIEIQGRRNDFVGPKTDYRINLSLSQRLFNDTLGVSLVATRETYALRKDQYGDRNGATYTPITYDSATNIATGKVITAYDYNGDGAISANEQGVRGRELRENDYNYFRNQRNRDSLTGTIQWRPSRNTEAYITGTYSRQNLNSYNSEVSVLPAALSTRNAPGLLLWDPSAYTFVQDIFQQAYSSSASAGNARLPATIRLFNTTAEQRIKNYVFAGGIKQRLSNLTLSMKGGYSLTTFNTNQLLGRAFVPRTANLGYLSGTAYSNNAAGAAAAAAAVAANPGTIPGTNNAFYYSGSSCTPSPEICRIVVNPGLFDDPTKFQPQLVEVGTAAGRDEAKSAYFDADWKVALGPIVHLSAGAKWEVRSKENLSSAVQYNNASFGNTLTTLTLANYIDGSTPAWGQKLGFARDDITNGWMNWNLAKTLADLQQRTGTTIAPQVPQPQGTYAVKETVFGGYVQADFRMFHDRVFGNFGVRYAKTRVTAGGQSALQLEQYNFYTPQNIAYFGSLAAAQAALGPNVDNDATHDNGTRFIAALQNVTATNSYDDWLPSLNINWAPISRLIIRGAVSKTIARPPINFLRPNLTVNEVYTLPDSTGTLGGTDLRPFRSTNLDLSAEWYFTRNSMFSVALYNKSLKDFVETAQVLYYYRDVRGQLFTVADFTNPNYMLLNPNANFAVTPASLLLPGSGGDQQAGCMVNREPTLPGAQSPTPAAPNKTQCDAVLIQQVRNGQGGYVRGVEVQFQHNFAWLPGLLSGLGVTANATYADSLTNKEEVFDANGNLVGSSPQLPLVGTSKWTFNGTVFYERNGVLLRVAYNRRTDYLINRSARDGTAEWIQGYGTLDVSAGLKINKYITLNFQAQNLTDSVTRVYSTMVVDAAGILPGEGSAFGSRTTKSRTTELSNTGRIFRAGVRLTF